MPAGVPSACSPLAACTMLGNGVGGPVFGRLYWKWGPVAAVTAHFATDVVAYIMAPAVGSIT